MTSNRTLAMGDEVEVKVSEPWEFESEVGTGRLIGHVVASVVDREGKPALLIRLSVPVTFQGIAFDVLMALSRYKGEGFGTLATGERAICNLVPGRLEGERFAEWAGSHLIGTLERSPGG